MAIDIESLTLNPEFGMDRVVLDNLPDSDVDIINGSTRNAAIKAFSDSRRMANLAIIKVEKNAQLNTVNNTIILKGKIYTPAKIADIRNNRDAFFGGIEIKKIEIQRNIGNIRLQPDAQERQKEINGLVIKHSELIEIRDSFQSSSTTRLLKAVSRIESQQTLDGDSSETLPDFDSSIIAIDTCTPLEELKRRSSHNQQNPFSQN